MTDHKMENGHPVVTVESKKFGTVKFGLWSATRGTATFEGFSLRGVEYKGYYAFKDQGERYNSPNNCKRGMMGGAHLDGSKACDKAHVDRVGIEYQNSYFRRAANGMDNQPTEATRREVYAFVEAEAAKLFDDAALVKLAHVAEIDRMVERETGKLNEIREKANAAQARLTERRMQAKTGAPFCEHKWREYDTDACTLPKGHKEAHEYGKR